MKLREQIQNKGRPPTPPADYDEPKPTGHRSKQVDSHMARMTINDREDDDYKIETRAEVHSSNAHRAQMMY